jgi:O-antigen biosynthesis protein
VRSRRSTQAPPPSSRQRNAANNFRQADRPPDEADGDRIIIHIARPELTEGLALDVVRGTLMVDGWVVAPGGVAGIEIDVDGQYTATVRHGLPRDDVTIAFPDHAAGDVGGFSAMVPPWAIADGLHRVRITAEALSGRRVATAFSIRSEHAVTEAAAGVLRRKMPLAELQLTERVLMGLGWQPNFGLLIGLGEIDEEIAHCRRTLASLREQAYGDWGATILRRGRVVPEQAAARLLDGFGDIAGRIDIRFDAPPGTILADLIRGPAANRPPNLVGILLAGDELSCDALLEMAIASGLEPDGELFYCDERRISPVSDAVEAFFKPQWSPDLLTATNYVGRFWCALPSTLRRSRATMGDWFQFGDYELILRCTETAAGVYHVPKILCERGRRQLDHPDQERAALGRAMLRRGMEGTVVDGAVSGHYRIKRTSGTQGLVSIIIPTCAAEGRIKTCLETLRTVTAYRDYELIGVENIPAERSDWKSWLHQHVDTVISCDGPFNWSRFNNLGAKAAKGDFLLFLNDDTEIIETDWLDALLEQAERPEVGVVGARLLYPDRTVQHAGIFWTPHGGRHAFRGFPASEPGYFGLSVVERDVIAVTGACFMVRRETFDVLGGFDESHSIVNNDVDFCLRAWERGQSVVYTPYATLIHHEGVSRHALDDEFDVEAFERRWGRKLRAGDPYYHPRLSRERDDYVPDAEPAELVYSSHPLFSRARIHNILAVKLDHIGDFVTAIPALQRLQRHFPQARLYLLASPGVAELSNLVPGLAGTIEFEFFFPQSGRGQRTLTEADLSILQQRLQPYYFDLALDLRKAPETRPLLACANARWLAGFDHNNQFPWLDIAVEWETDAAGARKRSHVSEDLMRLVDAVATATETEATPQRSLPALAERAALGLPVGRKFVCIHPGVGSPIRQWPPEHFAALIDLLAGAHDIDVVLIGGADDAETEANVMANVQRTDFVRSLVGKLGLVQLPQVLASAALFVGNNSGPKHLAARLGIPTIGIHSGTVDAREWGPLGVNAIAIRKRMICSPCYFSDPVNCPRELACLTEIQPFEVYEICRRLLAIDRSA